MIKFFFYQALVNEIFKEVNQSKRYHVFHQTRHQIDFIPETLLRNLDYLFLTVNTVLRDWDSDVYRMFKNKPECDSLQNWHNQHN